MIVRIGRDGNEEMNEGRREEGRRVLGSRKVSKGWGIGEREVDILIIYVVLDRWMMLKDEGMVRIG